MSRPPSSPGPVPSACARMTTRPDYSMEGMSGCVALCQQGAKVATNTDALRTSLAQLVRVRCSALNGGSGADRRSQEAPTTIAPHLGSCLARNSSKWAPPEEAKEAIRSADEHQSKRIGCFVAI